MGGAAQLAADTGLAAAAGWQALAHTRMATESAVTVAHGHPFTAADDFCLVHNGSFSNYASIRRELKADGITFHTDNDSEVAARFLAAKLDSGDDLDKALRLLTERFDGFYTLLVTTADAMAVVRDPIACKPALVARHPGGWRWRPNTERWWAFQALPARPSSSPRRKRSTCGRGEFTAARTGPGAPQRPRGQCRAETAAGGCLRTAALGAGAAQPRRRARRKTSAVEIEGPAGYYVGGLGKRARIVVQGAAGWGVGENLMSGSVVVHGNASQSAAATAHGGLVVVHGDASLRAGISLKGGTLAVAGDVGRYCGFLAQAGTILVGGDAAEGLGDSLYEAVIYVAGRVGELGTDARVEELTPADVARVRSLCIEAGFTHIDPENVTRIGSARQLYHFDTQHAGSY